jgi:hypothetical protein
MWWRMPPQKKLSSFWVFGFSAKFGVFDPTGILKKNQLSKTQCEGLWRGFLRNA